MAAAVVLRDLARRLGVELHGDGDCLIDSVATLEHAGRGAISFLANPHYRRQLADTAASAVILSREALPDCPVPALVTDNPYAAYARAAALLFPVPEWSGGVHPSAVVSAGSHLHESAWIGPQSVVEDGATIGARAYVGPGCIVGAGAIVGDDSRLTARVTICHGVQIGRRVVIHPGAVVGSDGFGLAKEEGRWLKVPQLGSVRIGDDVEIGANTTIDRGALDDTVLEEGVKLDNLIQVAHNVFIGAHTAVAGCVGISGSARIGRYCMIAGGVGIVGHLEITDNVVVTGMSMVTKSITEPGVYSSGLAAQPGDQFNRNYARFRRLDDMARRLQRLERRRKSED
ncbi:MAG: UDP-3-O-(3-hydroxymyristoyl)glucosamine N-acyltransferase [Gammaproteobacteria bacterium]